MIRTNTLITGSAKRIGKALAYHLAEKGHNLALHYNKSKGDVLKLQQDLNAKYKDQQFKIFSCNLGDETECRELLDKVLLQFDKLDVLINNASVFDPGVIQQTSLELYNAQLNVNLRAPFILTRDFALNNGKGNIINFLDTRISSNSNSHAAYSISKVALAHLTKMSALEFGPGIRVNGIAPGATLPPEGAGDDYLKNLAAKTPMRYPSGLEPILQSVDYILRNQNLTGQILYCDGGEQLL
jgi:NAD(P)-dependent dehydrogenase (short-subunit alcohol dehydrogenase family)